MASGRRHARFRRRPARWKNASRATRRSCCFPPWTPPSPPRSSAPSRRPATWWSRIREPSHGARCAAAGAGNQSRPPEAGSRPAARARLEGADRHQSELLHRRASPWALGAAEAVRHHEGRSPPRMQAISGAGYPGVPSMDIMGNVIPFIGGEEEKMQQETQKILGDFARRSHRAAGRQGQRALQSRAGGGWPHRHGVGGVLVEAVARPICATPSRPSPACRRSASFPARRRARCIYMEEANRPQPRKDAERERGMAAFVGRLRPARCSITSSSRWATTPFAARPARPC